LRDFRNGVCGSDGPDVRQGKTNIHGRTPWQSWHVL
jgi:hypothetical protein